MLRALRSGTYTVMIRDAVVPDADVNVHDAAAFVPNTRNGFVLLQTGMGLGRARGVAALMRGDAPGCRQAKHLPLGPAEIEDRAADLAIVTPSVKQITAELARSAAA